MGMETTVEIADEKFEKGLFEMTFIYLLKIDEKFSIRKSASEIFCINSELIKYAEYSEEMKTIFELAEKTKNETSGYFDIKNKSGKYDPSGLVKGWAIHNVSELLKKQGCKNFLVDIGNDLQLCGCNRDRKPWAVGIRNPFKFSEIVKVVHLKDRGIATSGKYARGEHIYNPHNYEDTLDDILSMTVIGPNICEADRFATPAFAMGKAGINFIEKLKGFEAYMIDKSGTAIMTSGFEKYTKI